MPVSQKENLTDSNSSSKCNRNRIIWVIYFLYSVHIIMIFLYCKTIILLYSQIIPGNSNMLRAILKQMFLPNNYTTKDFHSQIGVFMAHQVHYFYPRMSDYLNKKGLTYKAYVTGVSVGDISADQFMILAISRMWNISISTLSPMFNAMWNLYHESKKSSLVIIRNWREFGNKRESHHYSPTEKTLPSAKKLGHNIHNIDMKYIQTRAAGEKAGTETLMIRE